MKHILKNNASSDMPTQPNELLFLRFVISKRTQSIIMILISLLLLVEVGSFRSYLIGTGSVLLGLAAIGSYFRKHWVQYCFFAWGAFIYIKSLISLLASIKLGASHILQLNTIIGMFVLQCFYTLPFFGAGFLAQLFFNESAKLPKHSKSGDIALAYSVAICAYMSPTIVMLIANSPILPTPQTLIDQAILLEVPEEWLDIAMMLPSLIFNTLCSTILVLLLAMLFRVWSRWHIIVAASFIMLLYFSVGALNFFSVYMAEKWSSNRFFDGYEIVLLPAIGIVLGVIGGGLLATFIKKRV